MAGGGRGRGLVMRMVGKEEAGHVQQRPKRHVAGEERDLGPRPKDAT